MNGSNMCFRTMVCVGADLKFNCRHAGLSNFHRLDSANPLIYYLHLVFGSRLHL